MKNIIHISSKDDEKIGLRAQFGFANHLAPNSMFHIPIPTESGCREESINPQYMGLSASFSQSDPYIDFVRGSTRIKKQTS